MAMHETVISNLDAGLAVLVDPARRSRAGSVIQDEYDLDAPWHHHDLHQLQYAFEGAMELEDAKGRHLLPRSLAGWIPAGTRHRNSLRRIRSISILLSPELVPDAGDAVRIVSVSPLMRAMIAEAGRWPLTKPLDVIGNAFFVAFGLLCAEWIKSPAPLRLPTSNDPHLKRALDFTRQNLADCNMTSAAAAAGLSERTLRRRCQIELGIGWDEYRRRARLLHAVECLADGQPSIARIAAEAGFENQSAFSRAFQRLLGQTPGEFRASLRQTGSTSSHNL